MTALDLILAALFVSLSAISYFVLVGSSRAVESRSKQLTLQADNKLQSLFVFADTRRLIVLYVIALLGLPIAMLILQVTPVLVVFVVLGLLALPRIALSVLAKRRREAFNRALPDALAQLAGSMRAGSTFTTAMQSVVREQRGPLGQEFGVMLREQRLGARLEDALDNLGERVQSEELDLVISATVISQEVGGNLGEVLGRLSETLRRKMEMEGKIKALTSQGVLQGLVVTALPFLILGVLMLTEPSATLPIFSTLLGWIFLGVVIVLEVVGGLIIKKIVTIDV